MYYFVKNLKLLIPLHNPVLYSSLPAVPWEVVVDPSGESEAKLVGNPPSGFV